MVELRELRVGIAVSGLKKSIIRAGLESCMGWA
jgi:hypothetical protein